MTDQVPDISIILTAHREGLLAGVSAQSAVAAARFAEAADLRVEYVVVLDRADTLTGETLGEFFAGMGTVLETDLGDPGLARNAGVAAACGTFVAFLDGDDLWSENWLEAAFRFSRQQPSVIAHSACNVTFGDFEILWWHTDSESPLCDKTYMEWMNYWDAMAFLRRDLAIQYPFKANDLALGYGHEDWHWNKVTLAAGVAHKPVPETIHFKRRRPGTQMERVDSRGGVPWPVQGLTGRCTGQDNK